MLYKVVLFLVSFLLYCDIPVEGKKLDFKVITAVRHGLERSLEYIDRNIYRSNIDCLLGVAFVRGFMKTSFKNGSHIMDNSSLRLLNKCDQIIQKGRMIFQNDIKNGNNWKFQNLVDEDIWTKPINYRERQLLPIWNRRISHLPSSTTQEDLSKARNSDICLGEIINSTNQIQAAIRKPCVVSTNCWNDFFRDASGHGYYLTHKLLLLQTAKARHCLMDKKFYETQIRDICSSIMAEIINANYYGKTDEFFDLFMEQVLLCGYEGYTEFIQNSWLFWVIKSQYLTGCFPDDLTDKLKSRIKKDMTYFEDGCNDHTTGLGSAVLGLYYNYIVNEERY